MGGGDCRSKWRDTAPGDRAEALDELCPNCGCEQHSLRSDDHHPVADAEFVARILTSPDSYDLSTREIVGAKVHAVHRTGFSIVRQDASDEEIHLTVKQLTESGAEPSKLVGAAILPASAIRSLRDTEKWFCIYDTEDGDKKHHADVLGTYPKNLTRNKRDKILSKRRHELRRIMEEKVIHVSTATELIEKLRSIASETKAKNEAN